MATYDRKTFDPRNYQHDINNSNYSITNVPRLNSNVVTINNISNNDINSDNDIVYKGHYDSITEEDNISLDVNDIKSTLISLVPYFNTPIKNLKGTIRDKYNELIRYVNVLYDSPSNYDALYNLVIDTFNCANLDVIPGTVGGYVCGSLPRPNRSYNSSNYDYNNNNNDTKIADVSNSCSVFGAGSMPQPQNSSDSNTFCPHNVILGAYSNNMFNFSSLHNIDEDNKAVIHVPFTTTSQFPGFTDVEKQKLTDMGIKEVKILGYDSAQQVQFDLTDDFIPLADVKSRIVVVPVSEDNTNNSGYVALVILIIIIILILIFIAWRFLASRERTEYYTGNPYSQGFTELDSLSF